MISDLVNQIINNPDKLKSILDKDHIFKRQIYDHILLLDKNNKNNSDIKNILGDLYFYGYGTTQNYDLAIGYYQEAADKNHIIALNNLGYLYQYGHGLKIDKMMAFYYYKKSADLGNSTALNNLGYLYESEKKYDLALKYYNLSAEQNNSQALFNLGRIYENELGVPADNKKMLEYYKKSASLGNSDARLNLGFLYHYNSEFRNHNEAIKYYDKTNPSSQHSLGDLFFEKQKYGLAIKYYKKSSKQNYTLALCSLAYMYHCGIGIPKNNMKALKYCLQCSYSCKGQYYLNEIISDHNIVMEIIAKLYYKIYLYRKQISKYNILGNHLKYYPSSNLKGAISDLFIIK